MSLASPRTWGATTVSFPDGGDRVLWAVAIVFYGIGDLVTTLAGTLFSHVLEVGPLPALLLDHYSAIVLPLLKVAVFACCYGFWVATPRPYNLAPPFALSVLGVLVTSWNLAVLVVAAS